MSKLPELEIISDTEAAIVRGEARMPLSGGTAASIIAIWRHCRAHERTGETDAALFLWGLLSGLEHAAALELERISDRLEQRRHEQGAPPRGEEPITDEQFEKRLAASRRARGLKPWEPLT